MVGQRRLVFLSRALAAAVLTVALAGCAGLFFYPTEQLVRTPDQIGLAYREVWFESADGTRLHGWVLPAEGEARGTVLHVHGNAENISTHIGQVAWLPAAGFTVFVFDYRGYGLSEGEPSVPGLEADTRAALAQTLALPEAADGPVSVFGQSLGGAIAITALAGSDMTGRLCRLVTEGAFAGYRRIVREKLGYFWLTWPLQGPLSLGVAELPNAEDAIADLAPLPILIIHAGADRTVDAGHARALHAAAGEPKSLWIVDGVGHNQILRREEIRTRLADALATCGPLPPTGPG